MSLSAHVAFTGAWRKLCDLIHIFGRTQADMIPWTVEENGILILNIKNYVDSRGRPKWPMVTRDLPGRTPQEARCRYRRIRDSEIRRNRGETFPNKCHKCGQMKRGHICPNITSDANATSSLLLPMLSKEETINADKLLVSSEDIADFINNVSHNDLDVIYNSEMSLST